MKARLLIADLKQSFPAIAIWGLAIAGAAAAIWFLPRSTAAIIIGVFGGIALTKLVLEGLQRNAQIAILWLSLGVIADAAYAKLNDQAPVTIAALVVKLADAIVKLFDVLVQSAGIAGLSLRDQLAAVTPDFVWALILSSTVLMAMSLKGIRRHRDRDERPELRRAA